LDVQAQRHKRRRKFGKQTKSTLTPQSVWQLKISLLAYQKPNKRAVKRKLLKGNKCSTGFFSVY
jgi:hypothetical protein